MRIFIGLAAACSLAACQPASRVETTESAQPVESADSGTPKDIVAFAQAACGGCHSVEPGRLSPNPKSPTFPEIVNRTGLTRATLSTWLRDAHNYPEIMDFDLDPQQTDALIDYMMTMQDPAYKVPIS